MVKNVEIKRCGWCGQDDVYVKYHDNIWGVPVADDKELFAKLILDGAQAGLSWITILKRQEAYYRAFDGLNPDIIAHYDDRKYKELLQDVGIIRNKLKIKAAISNAQAFIELREKEINFSDFLWSFVNNKTKINRFKNLSEIPTYSKESDAMSNALKKAGFKFVGTTIIYAFMQAVGMVNDHIVDCHSYDKCCKLARK